MLFAADATRGSTMPAPWSNAATRWGLTVRSGACASNGLAVQRDHTAHIDGVGSRPHPRGQRSVESVSTGAEQRTPRRSRVGRGTVSKAANPEVSKLNANLS